MFGEKNGCCVLGTVERLIDVGYTKDIEAWETAARHL
jgi:hypothetical protein